MGSHRRGGEEPATGAATLTTVPDHTPHGDGTRASEAPAPEPPAPGRERYIDTLRAFALVRVVTYHTFGWAWLSMVFPSMGVMFALAGSLMARSLERPALKVISSRMRRLLIPLWAFGAVVVVAMMIHGWMPGKDILLWVFPVGDPPGNAWGEQATAILWYLRTYLWFVMLSPLLLKAFRLAPVPVLAVSLVPVVLFETGLVTLPDGRIGSLLSDLSVFTFCWLTGFAHRDGLLDRVKAATLVPVAGVLMVCGGVWAFTHLSDGSYDLDEIPLGQALWSAGFVLLLLRFRPSFEGIARFKVLDRVIKIFNARAVTIYLWHEIALIVSVPLIDLMWKVPAFEQDLPLGSMWFQFGVGWVLIAIEICLLGWIEDVAAKRRPRLLP
jgi:hypothetical protein